jgi:myxalamid-type polyketide synthase MxaE and MxaD
LITGGLGGLGPRIARWLVDRGARHLVLLGRRPLPERDSWSGLDATHEAYPRIRAIQELEARGAQVQAHSVDVADRRAMTELFAALQTGAQPLAGIIHAAAEINFCALADMSAEALRGALRPKLEGTWLLHELSRDLPLDFFVLFSSATTLFGAGRIGHYAASNQPLDFLARWRRAQGLPALSIDWGAWEEIRLLGQNRDEVDRFGLRKLPVETAMSAFSRLAATSSAGAMVADVDWPLLKQAFATRGRQKFFEKISIANAETAAASTSAIPWQELLDAAPADDRAETLSGLIATEVRRVLGLGDSDPLDHHRGLFQMGMDSLMSVQLRSRLARATKITLPATLTFTYPTVAALTGFLLREAFAAAPPKAPAAPAQPTPPPAGKPVANDPPSPAEVSDLNDDEVKNLLSQELDSLSADLRE